MSKYFIKRGEKLFGPFSNEQIKSGLEAGKLKNADSISESKDGPWRNVAEEFKESTALANPIVDDSPSIPAGSDNTPSSKRNWIVKQLDAMEFLIEGASYQELFSAITDSVGRDHNITGAFEASGKVRGEGSSGLIFLIVMQEQENASTLSIEIESPEGPINFEAWFDPTSAKGWALFAGTQLFNAAVNEGAANTLQQDARQLLKNIFGSLGCEDRVKAIEQDEEQERKERELRNQKVGSYVEGQVGGSVFIVKKLPAIAGTGCLLWAGLMLPIAAFALSAEEVSIFGRLLCLVLGGIALAGGVMLVRKVLIPAWHDYKKIALKYREVGNDSE